MILKTNLTRRDFLRLVSAGTCGCAVHNIVSPFGGMLAMAQSAPTNRKVVIIYLGGGACHSYVGVQRDFNPSWFTKMGGINGLAYENTTAMNGSLPVLVGNQSYLNPGFAALKPLVDAGQLAVMNQVGFFNDVEYTRSHDGDTELWQGGGLTDGAGIIGRAVSDLMNPLSGVSLDGSSLLVQGSGKQALSLADLSNLGRQNIGGKTMELREFDRAFDGAGPAFAAGNGLYVKNAIDNLEYTIDSIKDAISTPLPNAAEFNNGDGFTRSCYDAARLLTAKGLGVRLVALGRGGWDTHSDGRNSVYNNCFSLARGLAPLVKALQLTGEWENTVIITMSEFSRTFWNGVQNPNGQQGGAGSDHGHAGPQLVMSGALAKANCITDPASAAVVDRSGSYLRDVLIDFRQPYLEAFKWAGFNVDKIFKKPSPTNQFTEIGYLKA